MRTFEIDVLDKHQTTHFTQLMRAFMHELRYDPTDPADVHLFYMQESPVDMADVYMFRTNKTARAYANVYDINLVDFDEVVEFARALRMQYGMESGSWRVLLTHLKADTPESSQAMASLEASLEASLDAEVGGDKGGTAGMLGLGSPAVDTVSAAFAGLCLE